MRIVESLAERASERGLEITTLRANLRHTREMLDRAQSDLARARAEHDAAPDVVAVLDEAHGSSAIYVDGRFADKTDRWVSVLDVIDAAYPLADGPSTPRLMMLSHFSVELPDDEDWPETLDELRQYEVTNE